MNRFHPNFCIWGQNSNQVQIQRVFRKLYVNRQRTKPNCCTVIIIIIIKVIWKDYFPCTHNEGKQGEQRLWLESFLTSILHAGEWSTSHLACLLSAKNNCTYAVAGWVDPATCMDVDENRKFSYLGSTSL